MYERTSRLTDTLLEKEGFAMAADSQTIGDTVLPMSLPVEVKTVTSRSQRPRRNLQYKPYVPYAFLLPFVVLFVVFFFGPFFYDIYNSLYHQVHHGLYGAPTIEWAGLNNYTKALQDPDFRNGIGRVINFGVVQIPIEMGLALLLALLMDSAVIKFRTFFRLVAFLPYAIPGVVAALIWGFIYSPRLSPIVKGFAALHLGQLDFLGPHAVLWSIANISTWSFAGFNMIIFYSALQAIPQEIYESGRLDGLSEFGIAVRLKLPMIAPALVLGMLFALVGTLQLFNEPQILRPIAGSITSNYTPNMMAYNVAYVSTDFYYGGAIAAIMGFLTFAFSFGFLRLTRSRSGV